ncbi:hypothetical protein [Thalassobellus citreus]|uniref:hypothetical protein n=1 Tax=Thalassobellus citreus TaxID=3367752 RepID=UPI0037B6F710
MKLLSFLTMLTISLCGGLCCPPEDDYTTINIENNNIVKIENNQDTFNLGEKIYITTIIKNQQTSVDNQTLLLTDYLDTTNNEAYIYNSFTLYKETNFNTLSIIPINNDVLEIITGNATVNNEYIQVESPYNSNTFTSKFSITLLESGTFYLSGNGYNNAVYFDVNTNGKEYISISSEIINSNDNNYYKFTVN